uniref:Uncharacterized protein n=1 Tax=Molossus molossus TaxID=27622 RepID=A0A7J8CRU2_MOLMO|nr:hypothetical protein HJG59_009763 [Molossus molossus]
MIFLVSLSVSSSLVYKNAIDFFLSFFFFNLTRDIFPFFVQIEREGGRGREKHRCEGTHRVAATRTTNQGRGCTATEICALSGNRTRVSLYRRPTLQPLSQTGQGRFFDINFVSCYFAKFIY